MQTVLRLFSHINQTAPQLFESEPRPPLLGGLGPAACSAAQFAALFSHQTKRYKPGTFCLWFESNNVGVKTTKHRFWFTNREFWHQRIFVVVFCIYLDK